MSLTGVYAGVSDPRDSLLCARSAKSVGFSAAWTERSINNTSLGKKRTLFTQDKYLPRE